MRNVMQQSRVIEWRSAFGAKERKKDAWKLAKRLGQAVEYASLWIRMLSALCLGIETMIGYKRNVKTLGERPGE